MSRCEDYPCCGHGPPPLGDGGGCPDEEGRFNCVLCGNKLPKGATSAICTDPDMKAVHREIALRNDPFDDEEDDWI